MLKTNEAHIEQTEFPSLPYDDPAFVAGMIFAVERLADAVLKIGSESLNRSGQKALGRASEALFEAAFIATEKGPQFRKWRKGEIREEKKSKRSRKSSAAKSRLGESA